MVLQQDNSAMSQNLDPVNLVAVLDEDTKSIKIKNVSTDEVISVKAIKDNQGKVSYINLPPEVEVNIYHYNHNERWTNFPDVIMCLLTMHATLGVQMAVQPSDQPGTEDQAQILPSEEEY